MKIVIEGAGEVGSHLAKMLRAEANEVTVIDDESERIDALSSTTDVETVLGNPSSIQVLRDAGVGKADLFIAVYPYATQEVNIVGALLAKQLGAAKVIARINDEDYLNAENRLLFKELGIELMFYPEKSAADEIVAFLKHNSTAETMDFARGRLQIAVFKLTEDSPILDLKLLEFIKDTTAEELKQFRVIAISRDEKTIIPKLDTKFLYGDMVFTICTREGVDPLYRHFGKTNISIDSAFILGGSPIGEMLAKSLARSGLKVKLVESDKGRCIELSEKLPDSIRIVNGDGRNSDFLFDEGIQDYDAFIALTGNDESNVLSCVVAKKFGVARTIAEVENIEYIHIAEEMGVDNVINKKLITAGRIFKFTLSGKARFVRYMTGTNAEVIEYTAAPGAAITAGPIKDIDFPRNAIIGGVIRGSEAFIAVGDTVIQPYDRVAIFALPETIREIDRFFK
ncbi:MAG: Trk system potassium transporter TrkA [Bacteroidales bacterium]|jgi:trk system potassium uptake protein TrkA|nr:Trk system potassium transporter TrkA [Bacteroidales bacterium]